MRRREERLKEAKSMPGLDPSVRNAQDDNRAAGTERGGELVRSRYMKDLLKWKRYML
jgi:hypothetical protein